jgi:hypothetical protein
MLNFENKGLEMGHLINIMKSDEDTETRMIKLNTKSIVGFKNIRLPFFITEIQLRNFYKSEFYGFIYLSYEPLFQFSDKLKMLVCRFFISSDKLTFLKFVRQMII